VSLATVFYFYLATLSGRATHLKEQDRQFALINQRWSSNLGFLALCAEQ